MFDNAGEPPSDNNEALVRVLRQQRNNLAVQMLELETALMLERERSAALSRQLIAATSPREEQQP